MNCNQEIIPCKPVIPLLLRHPCRNSQFLFPSPFFLITEEERTSKGVTQLHFRQTNITKTQISSSPILFSSRAPRVFSGKVLKTPRLHLQKWKGRWCFWCNPKIILDEIFSFFMATLCLGYNKPSQRRFEEE